MYNDLLKIGNITIHGYGLMIAIGILTALFMSEYRAKKRKMDSDVLYLFMVILVGVGLVGAKLLFCIVEFKDFLKDPVGVLTGSGFVVYGGIIFGIMALIVTCNVKKLCFLDYFDLITPAVAIAQGFGRIGCFLAGCCYGRETETFLGITFTNSNFAPNNIKLLPTQLFSSAGMFLIGLYLLHYAKKERGQGQIGSLYLILYSLGRFIIEFFRNDYRGEVGILSTSQFISLFVLAIGIYLFRKFAKNEFKSKVEVK